MLILAIVPLFLSAGFKDAQATATAYCSYDSAGTQIVDPVPDASAPFAGTRDFVVSCFGSTDSPVVNGTSYIKFTTEDGDDLLREPIADTHGEFININSRELGQNTFTYKYFDADGNMLEEATFTFILTVFVVPESPIGVIALIVVSLGSFGMYIIIKSRSYRAQSSPL